ncbi:MAG: NAD(P)/FAD-dependent oxidoreductase [Dehalococcoidales bacterium]|nr:NAD(P)/FAD-dependent oxidoreductase [Dehalococcoidales bacterium]
MISTKYLIIGNSAGGIGAAEAIREVDKDGSILIISDEPYPAYSRPMIADYLGRGCSLEKMLYRPEDFYQKLNVQTRLGEKAVRLDTKKHTVELDDGEQVAWEKLLLATGGTPIVPQIEGIERQGVFSFTTLDDAKAVSEFLEGKTGRAVVIGGGLIGVSATEALVERGVKVTIVEMKERILNVMLDEETSDMEAAALKQAGVEIITGHTVAKINGAADTGGVSGVTLDDESPINCNLVVVAIGVRPRTELVAETGIEVNRGIIVSRQMATSEPDVYACGDATEAYDFVYNENRLTPIWPNAYLGGRVAGLNMAGVPTDYPGGTAMNSLKYFGVEIASAGMVFPDDKCEVISRRYGDIYRKVILKDGLVTGMVFAGDTEKAGIVFSLMRDKVPTDGFKEALVAEDFSLAALPEEIWRPRLTAMPQGEVTVVTAPEQPEEMPAGD